MVICLLQVLSAQRSDGQKMLSRVVEFGLKLSQFITSDTDLSPTAYIKQLSNDYDILCSNIERELDRLSERMALASNYVQNVESVNTWLMEFERNISETVSCSDVATATGIAMCLEKMLNLQLDLEHNPEKLKELGDLEKKCRFNSSYQVYDTYSKKYDGLMKELKV